MSLEKVFRRAALIAALAAVFLACPGVVTASVVSMSGLIDWFDPDVDLTLHQDGYVTDWVNRGSGNNVAMADPETSVVAGPNGTRMIRFNNGHDGAGLQFAASGTLTNGYTLFAAVRLNDPISGMNSFPRFLRTTNDAQALFLRQSNGQVEVKANPIGSGSRPQASYSSTYSVGDGANGLGEIAILAARLEQDRQALYFNGTLVDENSTDVASYSIGSTWEIGNSVKGDIGSVLVYDNSLSESGFHSTGAALAAHYGTVWIPEPSALMLLAFAIPLLTLVRRRNRQGGKRKP